MPSKDNFLQAQRISKIYNEFTVLNEVNFTQQQHQNLAIVGISGSGKTSLLQILSGHLQATSGTVYFEDKRVIGPNEQLLPGHKHIAYLSQHYELLNNYVVKDLIWFNNQLSTSKASELFSICNIEHLLNRKTHELSGGEKQRIALCKLLITQPKLLILDEPFSNLDLIHSATLKIVLHNLQETLGITILLASHNPLDTLSWADEIIVLEKGNIVQQDSPQHIYYNPINKYVAGLFGDYYNITHLQTTKSFSIARPNQIDIVTTNEATIIGNIKAVEFMGGYYNIIINIDNTPCYKHQLTKPLHKVNDIVGVIFNT